MALEKYKQKRNFTQTSEPQAKIRKSEKELMFVVQKHAASHLHYDFRLELGGVLVSWAVPKGPSLNPDDKRLAMMVEDHPYDYKDFEGNIPEGNYGAGNVIVWDRGTYTSTVKDLADKEKALRAGLHKGHLSFILKGKKLKGEFALVKIRNSKQENAWLLLKKDDKHASKTDVLQQNKSVLSGMTIESLEKKQDQQQASVKNHAKKQIAKDKTQKLAKPKFIAPMLAAVADAPFDNENWVYETKYDGYRTIAVIEDGVANLFSRNELSFNKNFKSIADALKKIGHNAVIDGEVVVESDGKSDFQSLQSFWKTGKGQLQYYVFDILQLDGHDTTQLPLLERKELLWLLLSKYQFDSIYYSEHIAAKGIAFFEEAEKHKLEGIIAKDANSPYRVGKRSGEWLKIKSIQSEEAIIIGYTEPKGARSYFGSLLLGQYRGDTIEYIGNCGSGFNDTALKELHAQFQKLDVAKSPIEEKVTAPAKIHWVKPQLVCQVKFTEWTREGSLRHPVFMGLRVDKKASEVKRPQPTNQPKSKTMKRQVEDDYDLKVGKITLHLTNQNKVYFPKDGFTKDDIVQYYAAVADYILPYLKNRPQSMNRFPNGINGPSFYQKDIDIEKVPSWLKTQSVYSKSNDADIDYLICNDKATLLYMANLGCIEINPWNSTIKKPEHPDWVVIDIDPGKENDFEAVVEAALTVKAVMDELETDCYCKTSGATGLHVYIPLQAKYNYYTVKIFAELIAHEVQSRLPQITTTERTIKKRNGKIYIDFLQNRAGQTLAAPYSVRPKNGATVSTPLEWDEVNNQLSPSQFTIHNILERLEKKGDLWKPVLGKGANILKIIKRMESNQKE
ncbi:MAG TPA: DNA ligase D [Flavobacterium sp.]|nr:DNA ligase D [Flavobacterium sp.]